MRRWRTISILIVASTSAHSLAADWRDLEKRIEGLPAARAARILRLSPTVQEAEELEGLPAAELVRAVRLRALVERQPAVTDPKKDVVRIKQGLRIIDGRTKDEANWLRDALDRLKNLIPKAPDIDAPTAPVVNSQLVVYAMWGILGVAVAVFLFFALRHFAWIKRGTVVRALVEEDEPERTVDEWLLQADGLEREGRFREAVRALYLACLLRLDEAGVARFIRYETNWEHQARIDASAKRPPSLEMRPATQMMDRVWYGYRTEGAPDVAFMRKLYESVLREVTAR